MLTRAQVERECSRLMGGDPTASQRWLDHDAALRAEIERLTKERDALVARIEAEEPIFKSMLNDLATTQAEMGRLRAAIEKFRRTAGYHTGSHEEELRVCLACNTSYVQAEAVFDREVQEAQRGGEGHDQ